MAADITVVVEAHGLVCHMPTLRLGQAIRKVDIGDTIELLTNDLDSNMR